MLKIIRLIDLKNGKIIENKDDNLDGFMQAVTKATRGETYFKSIACKQRCG